MKNEEVLRYFREMCGDFFPTEMEEAKRFVLTVPDPHPDDQQQIMQVPVFVRRTEKATYPQIRISQLPATFEKYMGTAWTYGYGEEPYENPNIKYKRARVDTIIHKAEIQVDAYCNDKIHTYRIRDALGARIHRFIYAEIATFFEREWEQDEDEIYYFNTGYDTSIDIIRCYEDDVLLTKTDDVETTEGSWNLTDEGLFVHPLADIEDISFQEMTNGGKLFSDNTTARSKGFLNVRIKRSRPMEDVNPLISRWSIVFEVTYREDVVMDVGRTFGEVSVND